MKNLVVVILCFFCMITFHEAVSRDAPAKETVKHYPVSIFHAGDCIAGKEPIKGASNYVNTTP